ncbi:MAG: hypothetical protein HY238_20575 [Acidobacteria bacterium]|nr:hypothetical protein [Acidobacteriota bacterium]
MRYTILLLSVSLLPGQQAGFDISALDKSANPCENFYQFACGGWMKANPIPSDQPVWGRFSELQERNRDVLHEILEKAAANPSPGSHERKIGDYYASCMDEPTINQKGLVPLKPEFDRIAALESKSALTAHVAQLHNLGVRALFRFDSGQDFKDSTQVIAEADQGGLGLPDRDYYFKDDPKSVETRKLYLAHVQKMFELLGSTPEKAAAQARAVMEIETSLAKGSLDRVSRRDPSKLYHRLSFQELTALAPSFPWSQYFRAAGAPPVSRRSGNPSTAPNGTSRPPLSMPTTTPR